MFRPNYLHAILNFELTGDIFKPYLYTEKINNNRYNIKEGLESFRKSRVSIYSWKLEMSREIKNC